MYVLHATYITLICKWYFAQWAPLLFRSIPLAAACCTGSDLRTTGDWIRRVATSLVPSRLISKCVNVHYVIGRLLKMTPHSPRMWGIRMII